MATDRPVRPSIASVRAQPALRVAAAAVLCVLAASAGAQTVYRSVGPDGKVTYSDKPPAGSRQVQQIDIPPPPPPPDPAQNDIRRKREQNEVEAIVKRGREQAAAFDKARADLTAAQNDLAVAKQRLADGAEPQAGERLGSAAGGSRLGEAYFERQQQLERAVKEAEERLAKAQRQYNDLRD